MGVPDAYRSQLYFRRLRLGMEDLTAALNAFGLRQSDADAVLGDLEASLARGVDSLPLPTIALELAIARRLGLLEGTTPEQRYESFFATGHEWQPWIRSILPRYEFLDHLIGSYVATTVATFKEAFERLARDFGMVRRTEPSCPGLGMDAQLESEPTLAAGGPRGPTEEVRKKYVAITLIFSAPLPGTRATPRSGEAPVT
jgi:hypothetical protein